MNLLNALPTHSLPPPEAGHILVLGGGETGCEVSETLIEMGYRVILSSRSARQQLARSAEMIYRTDLLKRLLCKPQLELLCHSEFKEFSNGRVQLQLGDEYISKPVAYCVLAQGRTSDQDLYDALANEGFQRILIGDANKLGRIGDAVDDAHQQILDLITTRNSISTIATS